MIGFPGPNLNAFATPGPPSLLVVSAGLPSIASAAPPAPPPPPALPTVDDESPAAPAFP